MERGFLKRLDSDTLSGVRKFDWLKSKHGNGNVIFGKPSSLGIFFQWSAVIVEGDRGTAVRVGFSSYVQIDSP